MLSWVAMERIYEREVLPDAKLRQQAGARPLRAQGNHLTEGELLAKLRSFGIEIDQAWLERECERALSAQEIAGPLMSTNRQGQESDWIWICVASLWRRWLPEQPSFEELDDKMQAGYERLESSGAVEACRIWLEAWNDVVRLLDKAGIESIEEFDERFRGTQSLFNWIQDLEAELWNASLKDRQFLTARIVVCEEGLRRFPSDDELLTENRRRALAESYFELGESDKAEALYQNWLKADPGWGWGWIGWSDGYRFTRAERQNLKRCERILQEGLSMVDVRDRPDLAERLADLCEEQGRNDEAQQYRRQARTTTATTETTLDVRSDGKVLRQKANIKFGGAGLPLSELSNLAASLRGTSAHAPVTRTKIGRNEPCLCGSGKKFKKCCGRGVGTV